LSEELPTRAVPTTPALQPPAPQPPAPQPTAPQLPARQLAAPQASAAQQASPAQSPAPPLPPRRPGAQQADGPVQPGASAHLQDGQSPGFEPESPGAEEPGSWFTTTRTKATTAPADPILPGFGAQSQQTQSHQAPGYQTQGYQAQGYAQARDFGDQTRFDETRLDNTRLNRTRLESTQLDPVPVAEPKRRSDRKKGPFAKGGPHDPAPTLVDQPQLQDTPVYQTGMQLVVPPGQEWTFRDPGTGAFPGVQQDRFGGQEQQDPYGRGGRGGPAAFQPPAPPIPPAPGGQRTDQSAPRGPAPQPGAGHDKAPAVPAQRRRGRKAPVLIGVGAVVVLLGIGAAVAVPRFLQHTDPGCTAYRTSALPAYNQTITDLNAKAPSQATLANDLTTAIAQLSTAAGQAQSATVKSALQGLLTQLTQVQTDLRKGSVPAATVTQLNTAADSADSAC
jgi:hypothetical protein